MKIIFLRLDKIGDLIATLPVDQLPELKNHQIKWVIAKGLGFLAQNSVPPREFLELDLRDRKASEKKLIEYLRAEKPDAVVVFYAPWWVSRACWRAGVPLRIARRSQWHSYLFFNRGLRQSRSLAEKHEADYNRELVEFGLKLSPSATPILKLQPPVLRRMFEKHALQSNNYYVVHPGMWGSALNWPQTKYNELIEKLIARGETVVITGTEADERFLGEIRARWKTHKNVRFLQSQLSFEELLSLLQTAKAVVAPSTGVLHLAAAMGTPSVGIYSPVRVHRALRWGPRGEKAISVTPVSDTDDADKISAECMNTVSADEVLSKMDSLI